MKINPRAMFKKIRWARKRHKIHRKRALFCAWCFLVVLGCSLYECLFFGTDIGNIGCVICCTALVLFYKLGLHYGQIELACIKWIINLQCVFWEQFIHERDTAFLSLDKEKIIAHLSKYNISALMKEKPWLFLDKKRVIDYLTKYRVSIVRRSEGDFWADVHKVILRIDSATELEKKRSENWLVTHGYRVTV